jgi:uncharacterized protein (TIGR02147 family)
MNSIFEYSDYRAYLHSYLTHQPRKGRGLRGAWATAAGCQMAYVSHVLGGKNDFSLEQAERISGHIGHSPEEQEYFLLMVQRIRAGTKPLRQFFQRRMDELAAKHYEIRHRMKIRETLDVQDQAVYYSKWMYSAIHILVTIPEHQAPSSIAAYFGLSQAEIKPYLDFLETRQLIELKNGRYAVRGPFLHIGKESPLFFHQQISWRQRAIDSIYRNTPDEIHFASCFSLSTSDVDKIRSVLTASIERTTEIIRPSKEEKLYSICLDFFEVR